MLGFFGYSDFKPGGLGYKKHCRLWVNSITVFVFVVFGSRKRPS